MRLVDLRNHAAPALFLAILIAFPLTSGACGRTACFSWSVQEGACPAQKDAMKFFTDPACPGNVVSVDSEGTSDFDGRLCCYAVTMNGVHFDEGNGNSCDGSPSSGSVSPGSGSGFGGAQGSSSFATTAGVGGGSTMPPCAHCSDGFGANPTTLCPGSQEVVAALDACACEGVCAMACGANFCSVGSADQACANCISDPSAGCGNELNACLDDQ